MNMYNLDNLAFIKDYMVKHHETIAVAESVTAGHIQAALSLAEEASRFFQGGITTYNLGQKCRQLHIDPIHATSCNCVSELVAIKMSENVCPLFLSNWGLGITGYAAPVPELEIENLFAFYSISYNGKSLEAGKMEAPAWGSLDVQRYYVDKMLSILVHILKNK